MKLDAQTVRDELSRLGEIAAALLDGEDVKRIITQEAMHHISRPDPEYRFLSADYYDVHHGPFLRVKKLLMRIERLSDLGVNGAIWGPVPETGKVTVALQNGPHHRYYEFGAQSRDPAPEMRRVLDAGEVTAAPTGPNDTHVTVLAPIRDSLQDVVGVVELTAPLDPDAPAWS